MNRFLVVVVALVSIHPALAELHEFKTPDGKSVKAEIVGFNARLGQVELKRENGKRVKVKPSIFVEGDQQYIKDWASLDGFRNPSSFKVECSKKKLEQWKKENNVFQTKFEAFIYEVKLENRNAFPVEGIQAEYRIFYEQEENDQATKKVVTHKKIKQGKLDVGNVNAKEKRLLKTEDIVLEKFEFNTSEYYVPDGDPETTSGELKGIWLRLTVKTKEGLTAVRNIYEPSNLKGKYTW